MGVQEQQVTVPAGLSFGVLDLLAIQGHGERVGIGELPIRLGHLLAIGPIEHIWAGSPPSGVRRYSRGGAPDESRRRRDGGLERRLEDPVGAIPIDPRKFVILAIRIVVTLLGTAELVAPRIIGSRRQQQGAEKVAPLLWPRASTSGSSCGPRRRNSMNGVGFAVVVSLAVCSIVFLVVSGQIGKGETVMRGNKVDAGRRVRRPEE